MNDHISLKKVKYLRGTCTWCYFARKHILLCPRRYLTFFSGIWLLIMLYREYPEKSFKSFSLLANALPVGIPAEGLGSGILQLGVECFSRTDLPPILRESFFLKDIFRLKHFTMHILQPECRRAGRLRNG